MRRKYIDELLIWKIVGCDGITCENMSREEAYVDLAIIDAKHMDENWSSKGDRDFHLKFKHIVNTIITQERILSKSDEFVIIRGVAGIGKTSLVDSYVLKWTQQKFLHGENNSHQIDFLFKLKCRTVNTFSNVTSAEQLLREQYGKVLEGIDWSCGRAVKALFS